MLDISKIRAIGLDLDDTLWPIWPTIERAELQLQQWLAQRAPVAAGVFSDPAARLALREQVARARPDLGHDMSALRRECIRVALQRSDEDTTLAEPAFEVFFEHRMQVDLFADVVPALRFQPLGQRLEVAPGQPAIRRESLGEDQHVAALAEFLSEGCEVGADIGPAHALFDRFAATDAGGHLPIGVKAEQFAAAEHRLCLFDCAGDEILHQHFVEERIARNQVLQDAFQFAFVARQPDTAARGAHGAFDHCRKPDDVAHLSRGFDDPRYRLR